MQFSDTERRARDAMAQELTDHIGSKMQAQGLANALIGKLRHEGFAITLPEQAEVVKLRHALIACGRYAYRMDHQEGHTLDRENARAIAAVVNETLGGR